jgi:hypothetical protein
MLGAEHALQLRSGAVLIRLCTAAYRDGASTTTTPWVPPRDALTANLDGFYHRLAAQRPWKLMGCLAIAYFPIKPFALVMEYADGTATTYAVRNDWCRGLEYNGSIYRLALVMRAYARALDGQRAMLTPPERAAGELDCRRPETKPPFIDPGSMLGATAGIVCFTAYRGTVREPERSARFALGGADLAAVSADFAATSVAHPGASNRLCLGSRGSTWIVGVNDWGDPVYLADDGCPPIFLSSGGRQWDPSMGVDAIVDQAEEIALDTS